MYDLPIPEEPMDGAVVLDRETYAWQRRDELAAPERPERRWFRVGVVIATIFGTNTLSAMAWRHLLVDQGPLAPMIAESAVDDYLAGDGFRNANYTGPDCATFVDPEDAPVSPRDDRDVNAPPSETRPLVESPVELSSAPTPVGCDSPSVVQAAPEATTADQAFPSSLWEDSLVAPPRPAPRPVADRPQA